MCCLIPLSFIHNNSLKCIRVGYHAIVPKPIYPWFIFSVLSCSFLSYSKKRNLVEITTRFHSLSFVVTRCHLLYDLLSLVVRLIDTGCTTCCYSLYHSLSFVVAHCTARCHSLSLDVSLVCLSIDDHLCIFVNL